jgi:8-oxo-dGTP pyrophosphatase MutT (NUDIX family)
VNFIEAVGANLVADLIWLSLISLVVARGVFRVAAWPVFVMTTFRRRQTVRFSASALLRVRHGDGYVLVVTPQRGESPAYWGPPGGVLKCHGADLGQLYALDVVPDWLASHGDDMDRDLRLKMPGARFWRFMRWYWNGAGRESPGDALRRELKEELGELGLNDLVGRVEKLEFKICPAKSTGLFQQDEIFHFRLFYVLDLVGPAAADFADALIASRQPDLLDVIPEVAIRSGRCDGMAVGGHSAFLIPGARYEHLGQSYQ